MAKNNQSGKKNQASNPQAKSKGDDKSTETPPSTGDDKSSDDQPTADKTETTGDLFAPEFLILISKATGELKRVFRNAPFPKDLDRKEWELATEADIATDFEKRHAAERTLRPVVTIEHENGERRNIYDGEISHEDLEREGWKLVPDNDSSSDETTDSADDGAEGESVSDQEKGPIQRAKDRVTDCKRKCNQSKRQLKEFESVHGKKPKGQAAADLALIVNECNECSSEWSRAKVALRQAESKEANTAREKASA